MPCEPGEADVIQHGDIGGVYVYSRDTVYVRADLPDPHVARTTAHECRHAWQGRRWGKPLHDAVLLAVLEQDADRFADLIVAEIERRGLF